MSKGLLKDGLGWGFGLWLFGYALGMVLFTVVPLGAIGWIILPIGTGATIWVLVKKIKAETMGYYLALAAVWTLMAVVFDYFFLVKTFKPADGYYKLDVYLYYFLTFSLPILAGKYGAPRLKPWGHKKPSFAKAFEGYPPSLYGGGIRRS